MCCNRIEGSAYEPPLLPRSFVLGPPWTNCGLNETYVGGLLLEYAVHVKTTGHTVSFLINLEFLLISFELTHIVLGCLGSF